MSSVIFPNQDSVVGDASGLAPGATVRVRYFAADYPGGKTTIPADAAQYSTFEDADGTVWQLTVTPPATGTWVDEADLATQAELSAVEALVADKVDSSVVGQPLGVASLDETGKVPAEQLPEVGGGSLQDAYDGGAQIETNDTQGPVIVKAGLGYAGASLAQWKNDFDAEVASVSKVGTIQTIDHGYSSLGSMYLANNTTLGASFVAGLASDSGHGVWGAMSAEAVVGTMSNAGLYLICNGFAIARLGMVGLSVDPLTSGGMAFKLPLLMDSEWDTHPWNATQGAGYFSTTESRYKVFDGASTKTLAWTDDIPSGGSTTFCAYLTGAESAGQHAYFATTATNPLSAGSDFTVQAWISRPVNGQNQAILSCTNGAAAGYAAPEFRVRSDDYLSLRIGDTVSNVDRTSTNPLSQTNQWIHVAVTFLNLTKTAIFYVNGVAAGTAVHTNSINAGSGTKDVSVGSVKSTTSGTVGQPFPGHLSDVRLFNVVRSAVDILADYNAGRTFPANAAGEVGRWKLDEGTGQLASDSASTRHLSYTRGTIGQLFPWAAMS